MATKRKAAKRPKARKAVKKAAPKKMTGGDCSCCSC